MKSMLFVPADSEKKLAKSMDSSASALILDLEDAVALERKPLARKMAAAHLAATQHHRRWRGYVRINPLGTQASLEDLAMIVGPGLDGIVLPKADGAEDVTRLGKHLDRLEAAAGLPPGAIQILVISTETPTALLNMASYARKVPRLLALSWGAEDLAAALGAATNREADGSFSHPYLLARSLCLVAAAAAGVVPLDTVFTNFDDPAALERDCLESARRGFVGRLAIHPAQVDIINRCFAPSDEDVATARAIVAAFAANPSVGTIGIDGKMYDRPHLVQAMKTLERAGTA